VLFGAGLGAMFGAAAHPRDFNISTDMTVIQMICGALLAGTIVLLDRRRA
jgi:hypothetical protein